MINPRLCLAFSFVPLLLFFLPVPQLLADTVQNSASQGNASTSAPRSTYSEVSLPPDKNWLGIDPKQITRSVFGNSEPVEGNFHEEVLLVEQTDRTALVILTQTGLADDSIAGMRYRLEFIREGNQWRLNWVGRQVLCQPGRGSQAWRKEKCH